MACPLNIPDAGDQHRPPTAILFLVSHKPTKQAYDPAMDHLALRWETYSRYYAVYLHSDLWGDKVLTKVWGGKGSHIGGQQHSPVTAEQIEQALQEIAERRRKHKYQPADLITREYLQRIAGTVPARKSNAGTN